MDETTKKAVEAPEINNPLAEAKYTKLAPSTAFLHQNLNHPHRQIDYTLVHSQHYVLFANWTLVQFLMQLNSLDTYTGSVKTYLNTFETVHHD